MNEFPHLSDNAASKLLLSNEERIQHIKKPRWIGYERAREIMDKMEDLLHHPQQPRMPNMLLIGDTNNGKTVLVTKFRELHPAEENPSGDAIRVPVLYIQAPPTPDESSLYTAILQRLFEPYRRSESIDAKRSRVVSVLRQVSLGMIMIDEIHSILASTPIKQRGVLNSLKYLGNELRVPIVGIGTADAARAVQFDAQLSNRFIPEVLPRWEQSKDLARLLASFERIIPLKFPSQLSSSDMVARIGNMTSGTIGEISTLLNTAAIHAIKKGTERIDRDSLDNCGYTQPSQRKKIAAAC